MKTIANSTQREHPELTPCPCGAEAVWYRVVLWPDLSVGPGQLVGAMVTDDFFDDLCFACFEAMVEAAARAGAEMERADWARSLSGSLVCRLHSVSPFFGHGVANRTGR